MTEEEKAEARATDPQAAAIIERCERMTPEELQRLHGVLRDPREGRTLPGAGPVLGVGPFESGWPTTRSASMTQIRRRC